MPGVLGKRSRLRVGLDQLVPKACPHYNPTPRSHCRHTIPAVIKAATVSAFSALLREGRIDEPGLARGQGSSRPHRLETLFPGLKPPGKASSTVCET